MTDEQALERALEELAGRCRDEQFASELYRGLASRRWRAESGAEVSVSWTRAEELVNELRTRVGYQPLTLAQTGGEGELDEDVRNELAARGWRSEPLDTSTSQPGHATAPESPPPAEQGERFAPTERRDAWERAHEEADAGGRLFPGRPGESAAKAGRDPQRRTGAG